MDGHNVRALPVLDGEELLGVVTLDSLLSAGDRIPVGMLMKPNPPTLPLHTPLLRAAQIFVEQDLDYAVIMDNSRIAGIITSNVLLRELRRSWDPLTGLGWSDRIREWCGQSLERGVEVAILFIDLDDFGRFNKECGHIVGDRVLKGVAQLLKDSINPELDVLVRYGGDEFVIGTKRSRSEAEQMASILRARSGAIQVEDSPRTVTFSVGVSGGQRSALRPDTHINAMVDELLNAASKDCIARKRLAIDLS